MPFPILLLAELGIREVVPAIEHAPFTMVSEPLRGDQARVHHTILKNGSFCR
jgi:hypothetical protein